MENYHKYMKYKKKYLESKFLSFGGSNLGEILDELQKNPLVCENSVSVEEKKNDISAKAKSIGASNINFLPIDSYELLVQIIFTNPPNDDDIKSLELGQINYKKQTRRGETFLKFLIKDLTEERKEERKRQEAAEERARRAAEQAAAKQAVEEQEREQARRAAEQAAAEETEKQAKRAAEQEREQEELEQRNMEAAEQETRETEKSLAAQRDATQRQQQEEAAARQREEEQAEAAARQREEEQAVAAVRLPSSSSSPQEGDLVFKKDARYNDLAQVAARKKRAEELAAASTTTGQYKGLDFGKPK